jgi:flagellar basal-body rod modification protein FlgD
MATSITNALLSTSSVATESTSSAILGKDDFLKLLIAQLKYQDPMNPLDGTEFASQLAQFSTVEQLANMNDTLEASVTTNQLMAQSIGNTLATTLIGKNVKASGNTLGWTGDNTVRFGYTLSSAAESVTVKIYDKDGTLVRTMTETGVESGDTQMTWDGTDDSGATLAAGTYSFAVEAEDASGAAVTSSTFLFGTVEGVRFTASGTVFVVDGREIPLANILEILGGSSNG